MRNATPHLFLPGAVLVGGVFCLLWFAFAWLTAALMVLVGLFDLFHPHWYETAIPLCTGLAISTVTSRLLLRRIRSARDATPR